MKKTTKFLLVLAAVVAMTIGAVSTVMAADYPAIVEWKEVKDGVWEGYDANGEKIKRGWAVSADSGIYYYFNNSVMQKNTFVKTGNKIYYVGSEGAMHTGWIEFNNKSKVSYNYSENVTVDVAFSGYSTIGSDNIPAFKSKTQYATVYMYFNGNGELAFNEWEKVEGVWYFFDGPFCLLDDWNFVVKYDEDGKAITDVAKQYTYGFDPSGAMIANWAHYFKSKDTSTNTDTPYVKPDTDETSMWVYYSPSGIKAGEGWLKDAAGDWYFMVKDDTTGVKAVINSFVSIASVKADGTVENMKFYFDASGRMVTDSAQFTAPSDKPLEIKQVNVTMSGNKITAYGAETKVTIAKKEKDIYKFNATTGNMIMTLKPDKSNEYLQTNLKSEKMYKINVKKNASGTAIEVTTEELAYKREGALWTETFLLVKGSDVYYYDNGLKVTSDVIAVGDKFLAFGSDGKLVKTTDASKAVKVDGVKYIMGTKEELVSGVPYSVITTK